VSVEWFIYDSCDLGERVVTEYSFWSRLALARYRASVMTVSIALRSCSGWVGWWPGDGGSGPGGVCGDFRFVLCGARENHWYTVFIHCTPHIPRC